MISEASVRSALALLPSHSFIRAYVGWAEHQTASHLIYHVAAAMTLAGATANRALAGDGPGFKAPTFANLYGMIVGNSGSDKTLAVRIANELMADAVPDLIGSDPTAWESLLKDLSERPAQILIYPEYGQWLAATAGAHNLIGSNLRKGLTNVFDGGTQTKRYSKIPDAIVAQHPRLSLLGACTPTDLECYTTEVDTAGGFLSRKFFAYGEPERTSHSRTPMPELRSWLVGYLLSSATRNDVGGCLGFDAPALQRWLAWQEHVNVRKAGFANDRRRGSIWQRVILMAAKMVVIFAWASGRAWGPGSWVVTGEELEPAIAFAELHVACAMDLVENIAASDEMREQRTLFHAIETTWTARGDALRKAQLTLRRGKIYLETLMDQGLIETTVQGETAFYRRRANGGVRSYDYTVESLPPPPVGLPAGVAPASPVWPS